MGIAFVQLNSSKDSVFSICRTLPPDQESRGEGGANPPHPNNEGVLGDAPLTLGPH